MKYFVATLKFIMRMLVRLIAWITVIILAVWFASQYIWNNNPEYFYEKYINDGSKYLANEEYDLALDEFIKARDFQPENPKSYIYLANLYEKLDDTAAAIASLEQAVSLDSPSADTYTRLLELYVTANIPSERKESLVYKAATDYPDAKFEDKYLKTFTPANRFDIPDAPEVNYSEGVYDPPIVVIVTNLGEEEYVYYTTDGEDPSVDSQRYDEKAGIELSPGRTTLLKLVKMNKRGYYSYVSSYEYTLTGSPEVSNPSLDATNGNNAVNMGYAAAGGKYVFYSSSNGTGSLWRLNTENDTALKLMDGYGDFINATDNYVYFSNWSDEQRLYRCRHDGGGLIKLSDSPASMINICDDRLYYVNADTGGRLHSMTLTGGDDLQITDFAVSEYNISGGYIVYRNEEDSDRLYRMNLDGADITLLSDHSVSCIQVMGGIVYYSNLGDGRRIYAVGLTAGSPQRVTDEGVREFNALAGGLFFRSAEREGFFHYSIDGGKIVKLADSTPTKINIAGERVFFKNYSETLGFYICDLDGQNMTLAK